MFTQPFIQAQIKENIKALRHFVSGEFPAQKASNAENVSIWWRHHVVTNKGQTTSHSEDELRGVFEKKVTVLQCVWAGLSKDSTILIQMAFNPSCADSIHIRVPNLIITLPVDSPQTPHFNNHVDTDYKVIHIPFNSSMFLWFCVILCNHLLLS